MRELIVCRVQHHPARAHLIPALAAALEPLPVEIIIHQSSPPNPWGGYQECLRDPPDCDHLLIVQDDAAPCLNFVPALRNVTAANPENPVVLFFPPYSREKKAAMVAMQRGHRYITLNTVSNTFVPVVAVLWPRQLAVDFYDWAQANPTLPGQREPRSDDAMAGQWKRKTRTEFKATIPSLVDHLGEEPSVAENIGKGVRTALFMAEDGLDYDW